MYSFIVKAGQGTKVLKIFDLFDLILNVNILCVRPNQFLSNLFSHLVYQFLSYLCLGPQRPLSSYWDKTANQFASVRKALVVTDNRECQRRPWSKARQNNMAASFYCYPGLKYFPLKELFPYMPLLGLICFLSHHQSVSLIFIFIFYLF